MGMTFDEIEDAARKETGMSDSSNAGLPKETAQQIIRDGYHELLHGLPTLKTQVNQTTAAVTYLPETLDESVTEWPDAVAEWMTHVMHYIKWRMLIFSRMDQAQAARAKVEQAAWESVFRTTEFTR